MANGVATWRTGLSSDVQCLSFEEDPKSSTHLSCVESQSLQMVLWKDIFKPGSLCKQPVLLRRFETFWDPCTSSAVDKSTTSDTAATQGCSVYLEAKGESTARYAVLIATKNDIFCETTTRASYLEDVRT